MSKQNGIISKIKDMYVMKQVKNTELPQFESDRFCRYRAKFSGKVQNVGFRMEVMELAKRLELTGFCKNMENGDILAELQGPENKIHFAISFMSTLQRIKVTHKTVREIPVCPDEVGFERR